MNVEPSERIPGEHAAVFGPPPWTFLEEVPEEALLGRLLTALGEWDPEDPKQHSVTPEAALELVEIVAHTQELIERSSLGEPAAKLLRQRASPERIDKIRRMLEGWQTTRGVVPDAWPEQPQHAETEPHGYRE